MVVGTMNNDFSLKGSLPISTHDGFFDLPSIALSPNSLSTATTVTSPSTTSFTGILDPSEDSDEFSDIVLSYISQMLMEEDTDNRFNLYPDHDPALLAAEKPFLDILQDNSNNSSPPSDRPPFLDGIGFSNGLHEQNSWIYSSVNDTQVDNHALSLDFFSQSPFSSENSNENILQGLDEQFLTSIKAPSVRIESQINLDDDGLFLPQEIREENESVRFNKGRKNPHSDDLDLAEGRCTKHTTLCTEETVRELFDKVLLCNGEHCELRAPLPRKIKELSEVPRNKRGRRKKQSKEEEEAVDLTTLLIHCSQAVAIDDQRGASELLKQIRKHSSPYGDEGQRLAHCLADGIQARLAGTGSDIYHSLVAKRTSTSDILKAYQLYVTSCPFKKISHFFSNQAILDASERASSIHIVDYGIYYGFQWPCFMQRLASRPGRPPRLCITGIDLPQPGFKPAERIEETGRRLAEYARLFNIPFEYHAIAAKWETIRVEDLMIDHNELLIVNCLYRFRNLMDETVYMDSPRTRLLNTIRKMKPDVFIHGIVNGSYSAPFFVTRFREALFHFSTLFDMLEANTSRVDEHRLLIERDLFGREALNVIACEGSERVERPETYKQWQVKNLRAGFKQIPIKEEVMTKIRLKVKKCYHRDFIIDQDKGWLLQGWKGRIIFAISAWKPN